MVKNAFEKSLRPALIFSFRLRSNMGVRDVTKVTQVNDIRTGQKCQIRCVAAGCSNTARPGIALYKFPKDPILRKWWERQMHRTRAKWTATESSVLCSKHFTAECFEESAALASQFGIGYKRSRRLVRGAVPTIFLSAAAGRGDRRGSGLRVGAKLELSQEASRS